MQFDLEFVIDSSVCRSLIVCWIPCRSHHHFIRLCHANHVSHSRSRYHPFCYLTRFDWISVTLPTENNNKRTKNSIGFISRWQHCKERSRTIWLFCSRQNSVVIVSGIVAICVKKIYGALSHSSNRKNYKKNYRFLCHTYTTAKKKIGENIPHM